MTTTTAVRATLQAGDHRLALGSRTFVMGILNVTPDSFSDGGRFGTDDIVDAAFKAAMAMIDDGVDVIDIGGESTRPGAAPVDVDEETRRVVPVIAALAQRGVTNISVDTRRTAVAARAHDVGACWWNDVSALTDDDPDAVAARFSAVVLMHMRGVPATMQSGDLGYVDVKADVSAFLDARVQRAMSRGVSQSQILVDPGIGFGKTTDDNLRLTRSLSTLSTTAAGVLYGPSRKRFLGELTGVDVPAARDAATMGAVAYAAMHGADIVRVHDVKRAREVLAVVDALNRGN